jgi:hypothetical protein
MGRGNPPPNLNIGGIMQEEVKTVEATVEEKPAWMFRKAPKVCIVGCADSKNMAPFLDPEYEIWGVNNLFIT